MSNHYQYADPKDSGTSIGKDMHAEVREEAKDLMKLILDRNLEYEGRAVSRDYSNEY